MKNKITISILATCLICFINTQKGFSQLKGDRLLGATGLDAGTQAPAETFTVLLPLYFYNTTSLRDAGGNKLDVNPNLNQFITGLGGSYVGKLKILGGTYGATVLLPFAENRIQGNNVDSHSPFAYSDTYVEPLQLGWHTKQADFNFNYGLYIPTGKYTQGADDNSGLGMWANEFSAGTTLHLDPKGTINFSTLLSYEINDDKKNTDIKPGDNLSIEGGLGKAWYTFNGSKIPSSIIKAGVIYYMQFKATADQIPVGDIVFTPGEDHIYALGLESNVYLTKSSILLGVRWLDEFGAVNRFQGNTFFVTIARVFSLGHPKGE
jgi:hypothetical protein